MEGQGNNRILYYLQFRKRNCKILHCQEYIEWKNQNCWSGNFRGEGWGNNKISSRRSVKEWWHNWWGIAQTRGCSLIINLIGNIKCVGY